MKIDSYQVAFNTTHKNLNLRFQQMDVTDRKTDFANDKKATVSQVNSKELNTKYENSKLSQKLQAEILTKLHASANRGNPTKVEITTFRAEAEELNFKTKATIKAKDKEIDVNLEVNLKRSFVEQNKMTIDLTKDPLIISLDGNMPRLSDDTFKFDLDSDGTRDQISKLKKGSGFLALDLNENGKIDNGNELFGTQSGNGFMDLSKYDDDGNGWIDENDKIFDKLRIWQKNEYNDSLVTLGEVGIGAVFLGNAQTTFSMKSVETNALNGELRSSGFFLFEDGRAGIISQIDLAIKGQEQTQSKQINSIKNTLNNKEALNIYSTQDKAVSAPKKESQSDKIQAKIKALEAKLKNASTTQEAGSIQAQIVGLRSILLEFTHRGL